MVISYLRHSRFTSFLALPFSCLVFRAFSLYEPVYTPVSDPAPLYALLQDILVHFPLAASITGMLLVLGGAFLFNRLATAHETLNTGTWMPGLVYIMLMSLEPGMCGFHPLLPAGVFLLIILMKLKGSYRKNEALGDYFDAGFLLGLASLFYLPSMIFMPLIWAGLVIYRPFVWKEWVVGLTGFLLTFLLAGTGFFLSDRLDEELLRSFIPVIHLHSFTFSATLAEWILYAVLAFSFLLALFSRGRSVFYNTLRARKNILILVWTLVLGAACLWLNPEPRIYALSFCAIPLSVFISSYYLSFRRTTWPDLLFYSLAFSILAVQALSLFKSD